MSDYRWKHAVRRGQGDSHGGWYARAVYHPLAWSHSGRKTGERNQLRYGLLPTFVAAAGDPNIKEELVKGKQLGDTTYKVHLDGYNQLNMLTGQGPSNRHEIFYFAEGTLGAVRIDDWKFRLIDQPGGMIGGTVKVNAPTLTNLRLDPYERMGFQNGNNGSFEYLGDFYMHEF
jgi:arylsulfatase A-like enzyme